MINENFGLFMNIKDKDPNKNEIEKIESQHILYPMSAVLIFLLYVLII